MEQTMPKQMTFADLIRHAISADGRTLYRLWKDSGVNVAVLQRFMSGKRGLNLDTAERLCRTLGVELRLKGR